MPLRFIEKLVLMGVEGTYATDPTLAAATHAFLTEDLQFSGFEGQTIARNIDQPGMGGQKSSKAPRHVTFSFKTPLTGAGAAGDPAPYAAALLAGQFAETLGEDPDEAVYSLVSSNYASAALSFATEGRMRKVLGIRGACGFSLPANGLPYLNFSGAGLYVPQTDTAMPTDADFSAFQEPEVVADETTLVAEIDGVPLILVSAEINTPSNFGYKNRPNQEAVTINARRNYTGKFVVVQETLATFDPHALADAAELIAMEIAHGSEAGRKATLSSQAMHILQVAEGEADGDATWELDVEFPSADDSDLLLTLT